MKHSIVVKFIAIALCALFLLTSIASGFGILVFTTTELYEKTVDEVFNEEITFLAETYAYQIAFEYASTELGGCPEGIVDVYHGYFKHGYFGYNLKDKDGNILTSISLPEHEDETRYLSVPVGVGKYQKLVSTAPAIESYPIDGIVVDANTVTNNIPYTGVVTEVYTMEIAYSGSNQPEGFTANGAALGALYSNSDGTVSFCSYDGYPFVNTPSEVFAIAFYGRNGELLYKATSRDGFVTVGEIYIGVGGYVYFDSYPEEMLNATEPPEVIPSDYLYNVIPYEGVEVLRVEFAYLGFIDEDTNIEPTVENHSTGEVLGKLLTNNDGTITFISSSSRPFSTQGGTVTEAAFYGTDGKLLYRVYCAGGAGQVVETDIGYITFESWLETYGVPNSAVIPTEVPEETIAEATIAPTEMPTEVITEATEVTVPEVTYIIAEATEPASEVYTTHYWDREQQAYVQANYVYEDLPEGYVLELWLLPGAYELDPVYDLLVYVWQYRQELFYILGVSILLFAITAVYLCCAAGRKPGREEIHADGLNQLPLDIYLAGGGFAIYVLAWLGAEGSYYLLRNSPNMLAPLVLIAGYLAALIIVGFSFACAAQFKTPDYYWLTNSLTARCIRFLIRSFKWLEGFLVNKFFPFLGKVFKFCWHYTKRLWKYLCVFALFGFQSTEKALRWLGKGIGKIAKRTHAWLHAFLSLLPVTWQWLLTGLFLLFMLALAVLTRHEFYFSVAVLAGMVLVVYGSHCFGLLWDSTKKISKGDLDTKVDDQLMVGAFKNFADDLNALADVAVLAAEKQLKSERMKTELITNVSHDIKTPLTSIINYVDLLQKPHTDEEREAYLEVLARQSQRMKKLLEDLMEMSKASTGNMTVNITRLNALETLNQALGEFSDKLDAAQLTPVVRHPEEEVHMQADGRLAWRVLSNLLSNVVKYALPGTRVYIDLAEPDGNVQISIKNISREELNVNADELMERFVRGDASRNTEGSGLGLNIAQSLMEIQKGQLELFVDGDLFKVTLTFPGTTE